MKNTTIGGQRLGAGGKMTIQTREFSRSTHDLSSSLKTTISPGTLVPAFSEIGLPGDSFDIRLSIDALTLPTEGPMFDSFKIQFDVFMTPIRLYQGLMQMNTVKIGNDIASVILPQMILRAADLDYTKPDVSNQQINPSAVFSYMNVRGLGHSNPPGLEVAREFFAGDWLVYWDTYLNYYANKQEEEGVVIHNDMTANVWNYGLGEDGLYKSEPASAGIQFTYFDNINSIPNPTDLNLYSIGEQSEFVITLPGLEYIEVNDIWLGVQDAPQSPLWVKAMDVFTDYEISYIAGTVRFWGWIPNNGYWNNGMRAGVWAIDQNIEGSYEGRPRLVRFPLENIQEVRRSAIVNSMDGTPVQINQFTAAPFGLALQHRDVTIDDVTTRYYSKLGNQEGLGVKTYQSDLFNNWLNTDWIDGDDGVNAITAVQIVNGKLKLDDLNVAEKFYKFLNATAMSDGTYDTYLDIAYDHERVKQANNPMYMGGMSKELVFAQITSSQTVPGEPLGTLAGRGYADHGKGGHIKGRVDEWSIIQGIVSITPRIVYSQGNKWDKNLKNLGDFHTPWMDGIGFQEVITDQMHWADTEIQAGGIIFKSAGKQPAWTNYTTNVDYVRGNFAKVTDQMFMVNDRRYELMLDGNSMPTIKDLTTYIDPAKYNYIFADARLDAMNFWLETRTKFTMRRKMSAQLMPNL